MRKVNVTSWISLRSLVLLLACSYIHSRLSRKSFGFSSNSGRGIQDRDKDEKPSFNLLKFITGSENDDDDSYAPFVNDDKRLAILSNQRSISRDELLENVIKGVISVIGMVFYYRMFSQLGDSFRSMGSSLMGAMKTDSKSDDYSALHPNVTKLLPTNATLNSYEIEILQTVLDPSLSEHSFKALGGLRDIKIGLFDCVNGLSSTADAQDNIYYKPVSGVLLFGPPGCGKSALVQAVSKKTNLPIIRVVPSVLLRKYVGDSSHMTKAIFTAAKKIQPCIIFIDEMDALFRARSDHEISYHNRELMTEFMQLWDGIQTPLEGPGLGAGAGTGVGVGMNATNPRPKVIIIGATNRPQDLDPAIQRRFQRSFLVGPPDLKSRASVFKVILQDIEKEIGFDYNACAIMTEGYTPSDISALCGAAINNLLAEKKLTLQKEKKKERENSLKSDVNNSSKDSPKMSRISSRQLGLEDIRAAMLSVFPTSWAASSFGTFSNDRNRFFP